QRRQAGFGAPQFLHVLGRALEPADKLLAFGCRVARVVQPHHPVRCFLDNRQFRLVGTHVRPACPFCSSAAWYWRQIAKALTRCFFTMPTEMPMVAAICSRGILSRRCMSSAARQLGDSCPKAASSDFTRSARAIVSTASASSTRISTAPPECA